jgi:hypothetical protein
MNKLQDQKYLEYRVTLDKKGEIIKKELTDRGHVVISERDAMFNNRPGKMNGTKLYYELAEKPKSKQEEKKGESAKAKK